MGFTAAADVGASLIGVDAGTAAIATAAGADTAAGLAAGGLVSDAALAGGATAAGGGAVTGAIDAGTAALNASNAAGATGLTADTAANVGGYTASIPTATDATASAATTAATTTPTTVSAPNAGGYTSSIPTATDTTISGTSPTATSTTAGSGITGSQVLQGAGAVNALTGGAITNALGLTANPNVAATASDPYAPYRGSAATALNNLVNNPALAMSTPGYQQQLQQGMQQSQRGAAKTGQLMSGNQAAALNAQGQNTFGSYYQNLLAQYEQLSGATQSPASAYAAAAQASAANTATQQSQMNYYGNAISTLGGLFSGSGGSIF
jgi:hypothetical protein